jgi:CRP-like cAMP-binding protein
MIADEEEVEEVPFMDQDWQSQLMDVFDQLDLDRSGSIDRKEFHEAFCQVGLPPVSAFEVFRTMDKSQNGLVDRLEWLHIIEEASRGTVEEIDVLVTFIERLSARHRAFGRIYDSDRRQRPCLILRHDSVFRIVWDLLIMVLLFMIALTLPYSFGFGQTDLLIVLDRVMDCFFCCDVVLNFRTSYADRDDAVIMDQKAIARKYLKSWFLLDFCSSVPFDLITAGLLPSLAPARFLKFGKIAKVMKLLRISKMMKVFAGSEIGERMEELNTSKAKQTMVRVLKLAAYTFVLSHWLACFGAAVDDTHLDSYFAGFGIMPTAPQKYLAAMYLALTTLTTVGYGDITPVSDQERAYAMLSMVIGGAFYGYTIGTLTSMISDMDRNARAYHDRMDLIQSWLDRHDEVDKGLRKRIRKYFKVSLATKSVIDDVSIISELSPELRADTAFYIVHHNVRHNAMFKPFTNSALAQIVEILHKHYTLRSEYVVKEGDPGIAMYILVRGAARYDKGLPWSPQGTKSPGQRFQQLIEGDSFGEEIIFGLDEVYSYTIASITNCTYHSVSEDGFIDRFRNMPELRKDMFRYFLKSRGFAETDIPEHVTMRKGSKGNPSALIPANPLVPGNPLREDPHSEGSKTQNSVRRRR